MSPHAFLLEGRLSSLPLLTEVGPLEAGTLSVKELFFQKPAGALTSWRVQ